MPRRLRVHIPGGFYHVTLRGNHRQPVFRCDGDRDLLNRIVARAMEKYQARLHAYCWMSNHLHFLIQVGVEPLGESMRQIAGEFARVMQSKSDSTGHFFERRHHATLVEATDYLFTALHYIHWNPVEAGLVDTVDHYRWSSHHAYAGRRMEPWLTTEFILGKFASDPRQASRAYEAFIKIERRDVSSPFPDGAFIFGSDEFIERVRGADSQGRSQRCLQDLIDEACRRFEVEREALTSPIRNRYLTKVRAWIAHQAGKRGIAGRSDVARALGRSEGTLRSAILRYPDEIE
jgi:REP element-mobilizing transposase RayT